MRTLLLPITMEARMRNLLQVRTSSASLIPSRTDSIRYRISACQISTPAALNQGQISTSTNRYAPLISRLHIVITPCASTEEDEDSVTALAKGLVPKRRGKPTVVHGSDKAAMPATAVPKRRGGPAKPKASSALVSSEGTV
jgi:hypothetical protein